MYSMRLQSSTFPRPTRWLAVALLCAVSAACAPSPEPVGSLSASPGELSLGYPSATDLELTWEMTRALEGLAGDPRVFLHLVDENGTVVRTFDHPLPGPWKIGGRQSYSTPMAQSALAPPLEAGSYRLTAGLYDQDGKRWALETGAPAVAQGEYEIAAVEVVTRKSTAPQFFFSSAWLGVEGGTDLQILARRWLSDDGVIRLGEVSEGGTLMLMLGIPEGGGRLEAPVLDEGAGEQIVSISTTCGAAEASASGPGSHVVSLPIEVPEAAEDGTQSCEVMFTANYHLRSVEGDETRTVALEGLSWSAG